MNLYFFIFITQRRRRKGLRVSFFLKILIFYSRELREACFKRKQDLNKYNSNGFNPLFSVMDKPVFEIQDAVFLSLSFDQVPRV